MSQQDDAAFGRRWQDAAHTAGLPQVQAPSPSPHPAKNFPVPRGAAQIEFQAGNTGSPGYPDQPGHGTLRHDMDAPRKSKALAVVLALPFLPTSWLGIHSFYLGHTFRGVLHLFLAFLGLVPFLWLAIFPLHALIIVAEFLLIVVGAGGYGRDRQRRPLV